MTPTKKREKRTVLNSEGIKAIIEEYLSINEQIDLLTKRKEELKDNYIFPYGDTYGNLDEKGSRYVYENGYVFGKQKRVKTEVDAEKAEAYFKSLGLYERVVKPVIDASKIEQLISEGVINKNDMQEFMTVKETFAIHVKIDEEATITEGKRRDL